MYMKIVFVGGGTGGHFYPLISVAEEVEVFARENQLIKPSMYYLGPSKYDEVALYDAGVKYVYCPAGKLRLTRDILSRVQNVFSGIAMIFGIIQATVILFTIFPDVIFSKGGYASFPVLWAARLLRIPVVIHDSDAVLGRVSLWSSSFAKIIGLAYPSSIDKLSSSARDKAALVGVPIRKELRFNPLSDAASALALKNDLPVILVLGGSSGAKYVNEAILDALPKLLEKFQVIHQTGKKHFAEINSITTSIFRDTKALENYYPVDFLSAYHLRAALSVSVVVISRAGSTTLFEIAEWGKPSIIIPIPQDVSRDQIKNAYSFARETGASVIEQENLTPNLLLSQINNILSNEEGYRELSERAKSFGSQDASKKIARQLVEILKSHEL